MTTAAVSRTMKTTSAPCPYCRADTLAVQPKARHILHGWLTILTGGMWGVVWLIRVQKHASDPWTCTTCGHELLRVELPGQTFEWQPWDHDELDTAQTAA